MISLITVLISLLGYGTPADYAGYTEAQLQQEITVAQAATNDGGGSDWDSPSADNDGGGSDWDSPSVTPQNPNDGNP